MPEEQTQLSQDPRGSTGESVCKGVVTSVNGPSVRVALEPNAACQTCKSKGSCALTAEGNQEIEVQASGFAKGEQVVVLTSERQALATSMALYLIPTLLVITGSFAGYFAGPEFIGVSGDMGALIGVVTGILFSYGFVHFYRVGATAGDPPIKLLKIEDYDG